MFKWLLLCLPLIIFSLPVKALLVQHEKMPNYSIVMEKSHKNKIFSYTAHVELKDKIESSIYLMIELDNRSEKKITIENTDYLLMHGIRFYNIHKFYYSLFHVPQKFDVNINSEDDFTEPVVIKFVSQKHYAQSIILAENSSGILQSVYIGALAVAIIIMFFRRNTTSFLFLIYSTATFLYLLTTHNNLFEFILGIKIDPTLDVFMGIILFNSRIIYEYFLFRRLKYAKLYLYFSLFVLVLSCVILLLKFLGVEYLVFFVQGFSYSTIILLLIAIILLKNKDKLIYFLVFVEAVNVILNVGFDFSHYFGIDFTTSYEKYEIIADFIDAFGLLALNLISFSRERELAIINNAQHERDKLELKNASLLMEIRMLNFQMNPHFFFNSLNCMRALMFFDITNAIVMLDKLVILYTYITLNSKNESISLAEEMGLIKYYLEIEKIRFEDKIQYEEPNYDDFKLIMVPNFSIFTLVENAVKHGVLKSISGGKILIFIKRTHSGIYITVRNEVLKTEQNHKNYSNTEVTSSTQTGLSNLKVRLQLMYGDKSQLSTHHFADINAYEASFSIPIP